MFQIVDVLPWDRIEAFVTKSRVDVIVGRITKVLSVIHVRYDSLYNLFYDLLFIDKNANFEL